MFVKIQTDQGLVDINPGHVVSLKELIARVEIRMVNGDIYTSSTPKWELDRALRTAH